MDSVLPPLTYKTNKRIDNFPITTNAIVTIISKLNPNKATGSDGVSAKMLILCGDTAAIPLKILFNNILSMGVYPRIWKLANVTPIHKKKMISKLSKTTDQYLFSQLVAKYLKK